MDSSLEVRRKRKRGYQPISEEARLRRNARRRQSVCIVRLPKRDFRRQFPLMMLNTINSHDPQFVESFIFSFCRPDCRMIDFSRQLLSDTCNISMLNVCDGVNAIAKYTTSFDSCSPDSVMTLLHTEIRMSELGTTIISKFNYQGTVILQPKATDMTMRFSQLLDRGNRVVHSAHGLIAVGPESEELNELINQRSISGDNPMLDWFTSSDQVAREPLSMAADGFVVIKMDCHGMITSMDSFDAVDRAEEFYLPLQR